MAMMRRPSYRVAVSWVAHTVPGKPASPCDRYYPLDALTDSGRVAVALLAELFGQTPERVAGDVLRAARVPV